jgi:hypothetical protein
LRLIPIRLIVYQRYPGLPTLSKQHKKEGIAIFEKNILPQIKEHVRNEQKKK